MTILLCPKKPKACGKTVLLDRSILIGQRWWKMPKLKNWNATFWVPLFSQKLEETKENGKSLNEIEESSRQKKVYPEKQNGNRERRWKFSN